MNTKFEREQAALRFVYDEDQFASVDHQDEPDFVLQHHAAQVRFGVEVTDLYETESDARAQLRPRYISELLDGGPHLHRDDVEIFKVGRGQITDSDGTIKGTEIPMIVRPTPQHSEHADALATVVQKKGVRFNHYRTGLSHVNLIVVDRFEVPFGGHPEYSITNLITGGLRTALEETPFREVFVVTTRPDGDRIHRPLRMLLLIESFKLFLGAAASFDGDLTHLAEPDLTKLYLSLMRDRPLPVTGHDPLQNPVACLGGAGVRFESGKGMVVFDFNDHDLPTLLDRIESPLSGPDHAAFEIHHTRFEAENKVIFGFAPPVLRDELPGLRRRPRSD